MQKAVESFLKSQARTLIPCPHANNKAKIIFKNC